MQWLCAPQVCVCVWMGHLLSEWMLGNQSAAAFLILRHLNEWPTRQMCETATAENFPATSTGAQQCEVKTTLFFNYFWVDVVDKCKLNFCCLFKTVDDEHALLEHTSAENHRHHCCLPLRELFETLFVLLFSVAAVWFRLWCWCEFVFMPLPWFRRSLTNGAAKSQTRLFRNSLRRTHSIAKSLCKLQTQKYIEKKRFVAANEFENGKIESDRGSRARGILKLGGEEGLNK